jgi:hypothetical protein
MKKVTIILLAVLALAAFVSCDPGTEKNRVLGKWECVRTTSGSVSEIIRLDVKEDSTVEITWIVSTEISGSGTWTAESLTNGSFEFEGVFSYFNGSYSASPNYLTLKTAGETLQFTRK